MTTMHIPTEQYAATSVLPIAAPKPDASASYSAPDAFYPAKSGAPYSTVPGVELPPDYSSGSNSYSGGQPTNFYGAVSAELGGAGPAPTYSVPYAGAGVAGASMHDYFSAASWRPSEEVVIRLCKDSDCTRCKQVVATETHVCTPLRPQTYFDAAAAYSHGACGAGPRFECRRWSGGCDGKEHETSRYRRLGGGGHGDHIHDHKEGHKDNHKDDKHHEGGGDPGAYRGGDNGGYDNHGGSHDGEYKDERKKDGGNYVAGGGHGGDGERDYGNKDGGDYVTKGGHGGDDGGGYGSWHGSDDGGHVEHCKDARSGYITPAQR